MRSPGPEMGGSSMVRGPSRGLASTGRAYRSRTGWPRGRSRPPRELSGASRRLMLTRTQLPGGGPAAGAD